MLNATLNGLTYGVIYAALAMSIVLTWRATRVVNFAQGALAMLTTYLAATAIEHGADYWEALLVALSCGLVCGAVAERLLVRRAAQGGQFAVVTVTIGLLIAIEAAAGMIWGDGLRSYQVPYSITGLRVGRTVIGLSAFDLYVIAAVALCVVALTLLFRFTSLGLRMRAVAFQPEIARLLGVRVARMLTVGWALAAAVGALAGILIAPEVFLAPTSMDGVLVYAFAAAVIGGLDSPVGAVLGGLVVGLATSYVGAWNAAGPSMELPGAFILLIVVLMLRPQGLLGSTRRRRV